MTMNSKPVLFQPDANNNWRAKPARSALMRRIISELQQAWLLYARQFEGGKLPPIH